MFIKSSKFALVGMVVGTFCIAMPAIADDLPPEFAQADTDGDGRISKAEMSEMRSQALGQMDANSDGVLTEAEISGAEMFADPATVGRLEIILARFAAADSDGDGQVTVEDMIAAGDAGFAQADTDGDGYLSASEMSAYASG